MLQAERGGIARALGGVFSVLFSSAGRDMVHMHGA